jgi:hypothetical protein
LFSFGDDPALMDKYGWDRANSWNIGEQYAHQIKQKKPNAWGLYDIHGNIWEWCYDFHAFDYYSSGDVTDPTGPTTGNCKVIRGGAINELAYSSLTDDCTTANRTCRAPASSDGYDLGFRLVKESKAVVDSDGDGIHDDWERIIFGNLTTANDTSDFDKDGYSDKQEYLNKDLKDSKGDFFTPVLWKNAPDGSGYNAATRKAPGDIDENGVVNANDVTLAFKFFLGNLSYTPQQFAAANVYNDRDAHITVTINDVHGVSALAGN